MKHLMKSTRALLTVLLLTLLAILLLAPQALLLAAESEVRPDEIQIRRQAVARMVFDSNQNIPLSSLRPAKVNDLDLMHPEMLPNPAVKWDFKNGSLLGSSPEAASGSLRWVGGFNPLPEGYPAPTLR